MNTDHADSARPVTQVAVAVLVRADGAVLLADRPAGKPYAGYWEFPGGKIESGETVAQALEREVAEELGVRVGPSYPWVVLEHDYPHAYVRLHFRRVFEWVGAPHAVEGQRIRYLQPGSDPPLPLLPAAVPALRWIQLPAIMVQPARANDADAQAWIGAALDRGARQILWRGGAGAAADAGAFAGADAGALACRERVRAFGARLLLELAPPRRNPAAQSGAPAPADCFIEAQALHAALVRPCAGWLAAFVRDRRDVAAARALGCDFGIIEASGREAGSGAHPQEDWDAIAVLCRDTPLPLFAPLPAGAQNLERARRMGAHGLAVTLG